MFEEINRRCFFSAKAMTKSRMYKLLLAGFVITIVCASTVGIRGQSADPTSEPGAAGEPYPNRPLTTLTFSDTYPLRVGKQVLELSYHGNAHEPGNIFIYAPAQRVLMVVDIVFPGWMPWRRFALAQDIPGYFAQVEEIRKMDWDTFVGGHVARTGTHADVDIQAEFNNDVKQAAATALATTKPGE